MSTCVQCVYVECRSVMTGECAMRTCVQCVYVECRSVMTGECVE